MITETAGTTPSSPSDSPSSAAYRTGAALDARARGIARSALDGTSEAREARWDIAALVIQSQLASVAVRRFKKLPPTDQISLDLTESLEDLLVAKIAGEHPSLKLELVAGDTGSVSSWLSAFSASAMLSLQRNLLRARARTGVPKSPVAPSGADSDFAGPSGSNSDLENSAARRSAYLEGGFDGQDELDERVAFEAAAESFLARKRNARSTRLTHLRSLALCEGLGVEAPRRVEDDTAAERLRALLAADPAAAAHTAAALLGGEPAGCDAALVRMWSSHPRHILEMLAAADPRVAQAISLSAATPMPMLDRAMLKQLRRQCLAALDGPRGSQSANAAITAWAEQASGLRASEYFPGQADPMDAANIKSGAERAADRGAFAEAVRAMAEAGVTAFGGTADEVDADLRARFAAIEDSHLGRMAG